MMDNLKDRGDKLCYKIEELPASELQTEIAVMAADYTRDVAAAVAAEREWISVDERLPKSGLPVIACGLNEYRKIRRLRAAWVEKYNIEDEHDEYLGPSDYCTETDLYYWPEGWYEWNEVEETRWIVPFEILYWMPLPDPPEAIRKRGEQ